MIANPIMYHRESFKAFLVPWQKDSALSWSFFSKSHLELLSFYLTVRLGEIKVKTVSNWCHCQSLLENAFFQLDFLLPSPNVLPLSIATKNYLASWRFLRKWRRSKKIPIYLQIQKIGDGCQRIIRGHACAKLSLKSDSPWWHCCRAGDFWECHWPWIWLDLQ